MRKLFFCCAVIIDLLIAPSIAIAATEPVASPNEKKHMLAIQSWTLASGIRVLFVAAPEIPMLDVDVIFNAGSAYDGHEPGIASITNQLIGQRTTRFDADDIAMGFENSGAIFGTIVDRDKAAVSLRTLTNPTQLEPVLTLFHSILVDAKFSQAAFTRIRKRALTNLLDEQQSPDSIADNAIYAALYPNQPYGHPISGNMASLKALSRSQVEQYYHQYYCAKNAMVVLVGAVSVAEAHRIAAKLTDGLPTGNEPPALPRAAKHGQGSHLHISYPSQQTHVRIADVAVARLDPDYLTLLVGNNILGGDALTSRLFHEVREKRGLTYSVFSYFEPLKTNGPFVVQLQTRSDEVAQAIAVTRATIKNFVKTGPSEQELAFSKKNIINSLPLRISNNASVANELIKIGFYHYEPFYLDSLVQKIKAITVKEVSAAFHRQIDLGSLMMVTVGPGAPNLQNE